MDKQQPSPPPSDAQRGSKWRLPPEIIFQIIASLIHQPAAFIFNVELGPLPHPPVTPKGLTMRFIPVVSPRNNYNTRAPSPNPETGSYESLVSKTIRSFLLTSHTVRHECLRLTQSISVPTAQNPHAAVRFAPAYHVICLDQNRVLPYGKPPLVDSWSKRPENCWTEINFDVQQLAFL